MKKFEAQFDIGTEVLYIPMYKHQQSKGIEGEKLSGMIVAVRFTKAKVMYDILDECSAVIFENVDAANVFKI